MRRIVEKRYHDKLPIESRDQSMADAPQPIDAVVRAAFERFDADGSGNIDVHELPAALDSVGLSDISHDKVEYVMRKYDSDRNHTLDLEEVRAPRTDDMARARATCEQHVEHAQYIGCTAKH